MRRPFSTHEARHLGITHSALKWGIQKGQWQRIIRGVYLEGGAPPTPIERGLGIVVATNGVASGTLAAALHRLDGIDGIDGIHLQRSLITVPLSRESRHKEVCRRDLPTDSVIEINGFRCTNGFQTMVDLATRLDDLRWEQALESALRKDLLRLDDLEKLDRLSVPGVKRMRRVLKLRPPMAPFTESMLETLMVQLIRKNARLPAPTRQVPIFETPGSIPFARVDLAWPEAGIFIELDGQQHKDQPTYDARRETEVVAATGWFPARFTWYEVNYIPKSTLKRLVKIFDMAGKLRRPA